MSIGIIGLYAVDTSPDDWRIWIGGLAALNFVGLIFYRFFRSLASQSRVSRTPTWMMSDRSAFYSLIVFLIITFAFQTITYIQYGGISGYINTFDTDSAGFGGMGLIFSVSESFPILSVIFVIFLINRKQLKVNWWIISIILFIFFIEKMLFGGLRGSRSNTVWGILWALGLIHLFLKPVSRRYILTVILLTTGFMYLYGFYKSSGVQGFTAALSSDTRAEQEAESGRDFRGLLLGDFGRSDIQSYILYKLIDQKNSYDLAYGRTYAASAAILIPKSLMPSKPATKVKEGTEIQYGKGSFIPIVSQSSKVYGLIGEAMLNFGPLAGPFFLGIFGLIVGYWRRWIFGLGHDARVFLVPFISIAFFIVLSSDSDNVIFFYIQARIYSNAGPTSWF